MRRFALVLLAGGAAALCSTWLAPSFGQTKPYDPLRSWNIGPTKTAVLQFVQDVTTEGGLYYVPPSDRIAVVEVDGVLLPTLPYPAEFAFAMSGIKHFVSKNSRYRTKEPFRAALSGNIKQLAAAGTKGMVSLTSTMYAGESTDGFEKSVLSWLARGRIKKLNRPYTQSAYMPMQEFVEYLRRNEFRVYAVAGGTVEFLRPWSEKVLGILPDQLLGTTIGVRMEKKGGIIRIKRRKDAEYFGERAAEAESIFRHLGKRPIIYVGSSDSQIETMDLVSSGSGRHLAMIIHHTDSGNEFSYDTRGPFGKLEKALSSARDNGWVVVDMLKDWNKVFAPVGR
jgi:hypothetical protein